MPAHGAADPARSRAGHRCAVAQVSGQHDLGLGPGRHVRPADPPALVVIGHAALLTAVDLHVRGVQIDGDRPAGQRHGPLRRQQRQHPPGHRRQAGLHRPPLGRGDPPGQPRRGGRRHARHRGELLARRIGALTIQPGQEILPGQLRRRDAAQQLPSAEPAFALLDGATTASSASITPSRPHSSVTAARPAFAVSDRSAAPIRTCRCLRLPPHMLLTR